MHSIGFARLDFRRTDVRPSPKYLNINQIEFKFVVLSDLLAFDGKIVVQRFTHNLFNLKFISYKWYSKWISCINLKERIICIAPVYSHQYIKFFSLTLLFDKTAFNKQQFINIIISIHSTVPTSAGSTDKNAIKLLN